MLGRKTLCTKLTFFPNPRAYLSVSIIWNICTFMKVRREQICEKKIVTIWIKNKIWEKILWKSHRQCQFNVPNVNIAKGTKNPRHWVLWPTQQLKLKAKASTRFEIFSLVLFGKGQEIHTFHLTTLTSPCSNLNTE